MSLTVVILVLVVVGVVMWLVNTYIPMQATIKRVLNIVVLVVVVLWILKAFGILGYLGEVTI